MCGIFGIVQDKKHPLSPQRVNQYTNSLFLLSESRGKEASGLVLLKEKIQIYKSGIRASELIKLPGYPSLFDNTTSAVIGHSRLVTNGHQSKNINNQPVVSKTTVMVHNGIIVNDKKIALQSSLKVNAEVDTQVAAEMIDKLVSGGYETESAIKNLFSKIEGSASLAFLSRISGEIVLATNTGSIFLGSFKRGKVIVFASESYILKTFANKNSLQGKIKQIKAGQAVVINPNSLKIKSFTLRGTTSKEFTKTRHSTIPIDVQNIRAEAKTTASESTLLPDNKLSNLKKHIPPYSAISRIKRCTKCILPETMPFISFNKTGICNYCENHQKVKHKGLKELKKIILPFRKRGKPDCILALSGGRDSSYGLHYVKKILGLNPIAYTYDWGMITDIARRNQARMVGKLGIEHVIVSADIKKKREYIKENVLAWAKKPDLGMVPLFAAGDKQAEYYIEELKKKTGIKLVIYCRGNELEDERFKFGHLGIFDGTPKAVIHNLSLFGKIKMALYYGGQYLTNPGYINSSLVDTLFAYATTYMMKHDFLYLWHFIPWKEDVIIKTLKQKYNWETSPDTTATWRIDDGTPSFYNYIYYVVQGFTEHDCLRSNQIREGVLTREEAIKLVNKENKPRYESLKWYFDTIGIDGHKVLKIVDSITKKYSV